MRIEPTAILTITDVVRDRKTATPSRPSGSPSSVVSLGEAAETAQAQSADPAVTTKIASIRAELEAGTYVVDLDKLSQRIFIDDLEREG
jgi:anti-sigma28 factor (negative regulator of flagellin synthesis)